MASGVIITSPIYRIVTLLDVPVNGGKLYTYAAGTSTPLAVYLDAALTTPASNPVVMNANGEAIIYLGTSSYKFIEADANGLAIRPPIDNISGTLLNIITDGYGNFGAGIIAGSGAPRIKFKQLTYTMPAPSSTLYLTHGLDPSKIRSIGMFVYKSGTGIIYPPYYGVSTGTTYYSFVVDTSFVTISTGVNATVIDGETTNVLLAYEA